MTKALAIAVIHGMGSQQPDAQDDAHYADAMVREINGAGCGNGNGDAT